MRHAPRRWFPSVIALTLAILAGTASPTRSQIMQRSFSLNVAAPGNAYLSVPIKNGLEGNSAYTIEAWVYPTSYGNFPTIVGNSYASSYWLGLNTGGKVRFYPRGLPSGFVETAQTVPLNQWRMGVPRSRGRCASSISSTALVARALWMVMTFPPARAHAFRTCSKISFCRSNER